MSTYSTGDRQQPSISDRPPLPRTFYIAWIATLVYAFSLTVLIPIVALYVTDELHAAEHWIGTATLMVAFTAVFTRIPAGALSDRHGRRLLMLAGAGLGVLAALVYLLVPTLAGFLFGRLLSGASLAMFTTTAKALVADLAPPARRGEALGLHTAAFSLAAVLSPVISEWSKNNLSFQAVFAISGILAGVSGLCTWLLPSGRPEHTSLRQPHADMVQALKQRGLWAAMVLMFGLGTGLALMFTFYPLLAERKDLFADSPALFASVAMGLGLSIWAVAGVIATPLAGALSDRLGRLTIAVPGLLIATAGVYALSRASNTLTTYIAIAILALGWSSARAVSDSITQDAVPAALRGVAAAIAYTAFDLAVGGDAQLLGALIDGRDFSRFFTATMGLLLVFGSLGLLLARGLVAFERRQPVSLSAPADGD